MSHRFFTYQKALKSFIGLSFILLFILCPLLNFGQTRLQVVNDSVRVANGELVVRNQTKNIPGVLVNKGNGVTEFRNLKMIKQGDSTLFILGQDTTAITATGTGSGSVMEFPDRTVSLNIRPYDANNMQLKWWKTNNDFYVSPKIGIIGDSQGKGDYASSYGNSTMGRLQNFIYAVCQNPVVINYSQNGYNSRRLAPTGSNAFVDNQYNITKALADGNKIIILCNTGNDFLNSGAGGPVPVSEAMANTLLIAEACEKAGATLFVISTNPGGSARPIELRDSARIMAGLLRQKFGERCAYTFKLLEDPANPNYLLPSLRLSDDIHLNDAGCAVLFGAVRDMLTSYYASNNMVAGYQLQKANTFSGIYSDFQFINNATQPSLVKAKDSAFYRVRIKFHNGYYSDWSNIGQGSAAYQEAPGELLPVVAGNGPIRVQVPKDSTTLIATASDANPGGSIQSYNWFRVNGNSLATIQHPTQASTRVTGLSEGSYLFRVEVKNALNKTAYADVPVIVSSAIVYPRAQFSFSAGSQSIPGWVSIAGSPINAATNNVYWTDNTTGISILNIASTNQKWGSAYGTNSGDASGETVADAGGFAVPAAVLRSSWFSNNVSYVDNNSNQLKVTGLSPAKRYAIRFYPSIATSFTLDADPTEYIVNNSLLNRKRLNAKGNTSNAAVFRGVAPGTDGTISLFVGVPAGQAQFGMLNALTVEEEAGGGTNQLPVVTPGTNKTIQLPTTVASIAVAAEDPDGQIGSVNWSRITGPSTAIINSPSTLETNVDFTEAGSYVFRCTVTDEDGGTAFGEVTVTVQAANANPTLQIGVSKTAYTQSGWRVIAGSPHQAVLADTSVFAGNSVIVNTVNTTGNWVPWSSSVSADATGETVDDGFGFTAPARVTQGCFFNANSYAADKPQMQVLNLPAGVYKVTLFGSLKSTVSPSVNSQTQYRVNTMSPITVNTRANTSKTAVFNNVSVSAGSPLNIFFNPVTGGSNSYAGLLNYIVIEKLSNQ